MIYITAPFATMQSFYPMRPLTGDLKQFMDNLNKPFPKKGLDGKQIIGPDGKIVMVQPNNTPCCIQVSHALNMAGQKIPATYNYAKQRGRSPSPIQVNGLTNYYLLAVDELEQWLTQKYGAGLEVRALAGLPKTPSGNLIQRKKDMEQMKDYLSGYTGILLFRDVGAGLHTELWDGSQILQRDMDEVNLFSQSRVLMWYCAS